MLHDFMVLEGRKETGEGKLQEALRTSASEVKVAFRFVINYEEVKAKLYMLTTRHRMRRSIMGFAGAAYCCRHNDRRKSTMIRVIDEHRRT